MVEARKYIRTRKVGDGDYLSSSVTNKRTCIQVGIARSKAGYNDPKWHARLCDKLDEAAVPGFWRQLLGRVRYLTCRELSCPCQCSCLRHCLLERDLTVRTRLDTPSQESDLEGIDLFAETVFEMLYRALAWDSLLGKMRRRIALIRDDIIREAVEIFER